ncbi:LOW QUALITY PROTEIN: hypothetical protein PHMEG_00039158 [Phytophthora megakarya]|uniref:Eukaryotic/viral aspartic protease n=1 Tax=Phytophthora megakarya TaxID=4795 RepID=A0A225UG65_9STRA|nr:LOW QUALITY PROTEIN: hypothetical protein PHMEG_00039158 [Phytophthora megakarya]
MLEARSKIRRSSPARCSRRDNGSAPTDQATATESSDRSVGTLQKFCTAAMDRLLAEEREANKDPTTTRPQHQGSQGVEMESIRSSNHGTRWEYDPDDVDFPASAQATVTTAAAGSTGSPMIQRLKLLSCEIKRQRTKVLDLRGSSRWIREELVSLAESTRNKWIDLLRSFQIQYCGLGVSQDILPYATQIRRVATGLLVSAGLRARLKIKDGSAKERREHVDHYIETLENQDLAERLTLPRLTDADGLGEVLRPRDRGKNRQKKAAFGSSKYRQKPTSTTPSAPAQQERDPDPS